MRPDYRTECVWLASSRKSEQQPMACPHCHCRCGGEPHPSAETRERRAKLTPEERAHNRRETQRQYYEKTNVDRRDKHHEEQRRWYLANRDMLNEKQREKRRLAREARAMLAAADNGGAEADGVAEAAS